MVVIKNIFMPPQHCGSRSSAIDKFLELYGEKTGMINIFLCCIHSPSHLYLSLLVQHWMVISSNIEDITRRLEDMNFIFECKNNILRTSAASE